MREFFVWSGVRHGDRQAFLREEQKSPHVTEKGGSLNQTH